MMRSFSIYDAATVCIPTVPFEQLVELDQIVEGVTYTLGVMHQGEYKAPTVTNDINVLTYVVEELRRQYGSDCFIMIQPETNYETLCMVRADKDGISIIPSLSEYDDGIVRRLMDAVGTHYDLNQGLAATLVKDSRDTILFKTITTD